MPSVSLLAIVGGMHSGQTVCVCTEIIYCCGNVLVELVDACPIQLV